MAACEQVSSQTILHVKTGIHTLHLHRLSVMLKHLLVFVPSSWQTVAPPKHWHELNIHKSMRDILGEKSRGFSQSSRSKCKLLLLRRDNGVVAKACCAFQASKRHSTRIPALLEYQTLQFVIQFSEQWGFIYAVCIRLWCAVSVMIKHTALI